MAEPVDFSHTASHAILWTRQHLNADALRMLKALPLLQIIDNRFIMVHAALHPTPNDTLRLHDEHQIAQTLAVLAAHYPAIKLCFFGHTHRQVAYSSDGRRIRHLHGPVIHLDPNTRYLLNPGSVGQSRGSNPKAAFLVFDASRQTIQFCHAAYDQQACLRKARQAGLLPQHNLVARSAAWLWRRINSGNVSPAHR